MEQCSTDLGCVTSEVDAKRRLFLIGRFGTGLLKARISQAKPQANTSPTQILKAESRDCGYPLCCEC
jgi:hypothetical protein